MKQLSFEEIPTGFCRCGCGQKTNIALRNRTSPKQVKGQFLDYVLGHSRKHRGGPKVPIGKKWCFGCQKVKNVEEFFRHKHAVSGLQGVCKVCSLARRRKWNKKNIDRVQFYNIKGRLKRDFGIDIEVYNSLVEKQNNLCAICNKPETVRQNGHIKSLAVDHNHTTGNIRGLLCNNCNRALGLLGDNPDMLKNVIDYLAKHSE